MKLTETQTEQLTALLSATWNGRADMIKHCLTDYKYIVLSDGRFVEVGKAKPKIENDIYYDDETQAPNINRFEVFKNYNMRGKNWGYEKLEDHNFGEVSTLKLYAKYHGDKTDGKLLGVGYRRASENAIEDVTPETLKLINDAQEELKQDYEKRLANYWKRYSNKVHSVGYWANR